MGDAYVTGAGMLNRREFIAAAACSIVANPMDADAWSHGSPGGGQGGGSNLLAANMFSPAFGASLTQRVFGKAAASTADYYHIDGGPYWFNCYDLNAMGAWGQALATSKGYRYLFFLCMDHSSFWGRDASFVYTGYSNDPAIMPDPSTLKAIISGGFEGYLVPGTGGTTAYNITMFPVFVYNPDEATNKGYLYVQGFNNGATITPSPSFSTVLFSTPDLDTWTVQGLAMAAIAADGFAATGTPIRRGTGDWIAYSASTPNPALGSGPYQWTSTDGKTFTLGSPFVTDWDDNPGVTPKRQFSANLVSKLITIGADTYSVVYDDARGPGWFSGTTYALNAIVSGADSLAYKSKAGSNTNHNPVTDNGTWWQPLGGFGQYVTLVPVNAATGSIIATGSPAAIRLSAKYNGIYPSPTYLQSVSAYLESGILTIWALHGYFNDNPGSTDGLAYNGTYTGGGMREEYTDLYAYVTDATAALAAAPLGVRASAAAGVATINWYDVPAGRTYRLYRGTTAGTQATLIGDFTGTSATDAPTVGSVYYYKLVALNAGVEQGSRIVSTYVS